ncbi:PAS domain-containing protein [Kordiimonas laminariae]|uniref:PAS domain-containing protein n=1 Tax=Kordiimonas laminariae TaxID=2917717 RepID=UPI001FF23AF3|nr:PAS domain-containing protein [Kordiimonas laminariae]MCK0070898.1 PAS domain-containing protein [Kordiimonas laminariae]
MTKRNIVPTGEEIAFGEHEIIVSKTDTKGRILYANDVFCKVAEMQTNDVIGQPHSIIRHPDMPRAVFKLLWDKIAAGEEVFAYVKNMSFTGKYYWVFAHVTPSFDHAGRISGYHSNRRKPKPVALEAIKPIYKALLDEEKRHKNRTDGLAASYKLLEDTLAHAGQTYSEFVWGAGGAHV